MSLNPLTVKALRRFRGLKRAYASFWILAGLYALSLGAELLCNGTPLWVRFEGRSYFPVLRFYPDDVFTGSGKFSRPDYKQIARSERFRQNPSNWMRFAPLPYGPLESVPFESIALPDQVAIILDPAPRVGTLTLAPDFTIAGASAASEFLGADDAALAGRSLAEFLALPEAFRQAVAARLANRAAPSLAVDAAAQGGRKVRLSLATFAPRRAAPAGVRVTLREPQESALRPETVRIGRDQEMGKEDRPRSGHDGAWPSISESSLSGGTRSVASVFSSTRNHDPATAEHGPPFPDHLSLEGRALSPPNKPADSIWNMLAPADRQALLALARARFEAPVAETNILAAGRSVAVRFDREEVRYPLRPVPGHPLGIDSAGRDVLARILYGLRISLSFGLLLVVVTMGVGILVGAFQGYYGGAADMIGQRVIEIWDALPFLYILILMGSVFGRSFGLLLLCYGLFNWIGISYYQRGEFLRLRRQAFVEAARCMGIAPLKIMFRHILPNALAPVITFFPFSLVGAIGLLAALDYLGFGLPPPTPSWGELLTQAQEYSWAWWLALYPALALFVVMLLGVFVGEGVRAAFDPRPASRME